MSKRSSVYINKKNLIPVFVIGIVMLAIAYSKFVSDRNILYESDVDQGIKPTTSTGIDAVIPSGWIKYSARTARKQNSGFPLAYTFYYPEDWNINTVENIPSLDIVLDNQKVGTIYINPGGHGGGNPVKTIRYVTEMYPAGQVEITELLEQNDMVSGTFWFVGKPNNAPLQPIFGFEFRYSYNRYEKLKPIFSQILNTVTLTY